MKNIRCKLAYVLECLVYIWNSFNKPDSADLIYVIILVVNKFKTMHLEMCETQKLCGKQETLFSWFPIWYIIYYLLIWVIFFQIYVETLMLLILSELISWLFVTEFDQHFRKTKGRVQPKKNANYPPTPPKLLIQIQGPHPVILKKWIICLFFLQPFL